MTCSKDLSNRPLYYVLNTHNLNMIPQLKYMPLVMNPARIASSDWKLEMLWSVMRLIFKTSSVTSDFFFFFFCIILSFFFFEVNVSKKSVRGKFWARTSLSYAGYVNCKKQHKITAQRRRKETRVEIKLFSLLSICAGIWMAFLLSAHIFHDFKIFRSILAVLF